MRKAIYLLFVALIAMMVVPAAAQDAPCTVSTPKHNTVRLRETPDTKGAVAGFLPADTQFNVTGKFLAPRNAIWFKLVKEEVAPTATSAEVWVGAVAVVTAGNCDAVAVLNPAPAAPAAPANPADPAAPAPAPVAALLPKNGRWNMTMTPSVNFSCANGFNYTVNLEEDQTQLGPFRIRSARAGYFTIDGYRMDPTPDGKFAGQLFAVSADFEGNDAIALTVESDIHMSGLYVITITDNDLTCATTIPITMDWVRR